MSDSLGVVEREFNGHKEPAKLAFSSITMALGQPTIPFQTQVGRHDISSVLFVKLKIEKEKNDMDHRGNEPAIRD